MGKRTNRQRIIDVIRHAAPAELTRVEIEAAVPDMPTGSARGVLLTLGERPEDQIIRSKPGGKRTSPRTWRWNGA